MSASPAKNRRVALMASGLVVAMLGLAYASVPLYRLFCQITGFGGTTQTAEVAPAASTDIDITVRFDANIDSALAWSFHPEAPTQKLKIGAVAMANYIAENTKNEPSTGSAVFNVTPPEAGAYFNKLECFCFTNQTLTPGQRVIMPVQYFIDPAILDDPDTRGIREITLSYTFYPARTPANDKQARVETN